MKLDEVIDLILKYEDRMLKQYRENILNNFRKNSKSEQVLSERQYFIMYIILYKEINTITDIANYLSLSKANISILTSKLEENGFIFRDRKESTDSRVSIIKVTEEGERNFREIRNRLSISLREKFQEYEEAQLDLRSTVNNLKRVTNISETTENVEDVLLLVSMKLNNIFEEIYYSIIKLHDYNLSVAEFKIIKTIGMLEKKTHFEVLTEVMCLSYSTLSLQVKGLVEKGFIEKKKSFDDGRVTYVVLSDKGHEVFETFKKQKYEIVKSRLSHKSNVEIIDFVNVFEGLFKIMEVAHSKKV